MMVNLYGRMEKVDEVKYFKVEDLQNLDTEEFEWLESLKRIVEV